MAQKLKRVYGQTIWELFLRKICVAYKSSYIPAPSVNNRTYQVHRICSKIRILLLLSLLSLGKKNNIVQQSFTTALPFMYDMKAL